MNWIITNQFILKFGINMELDKLTILINRYKRAVEMNEDGSEGDREEKAKDELISYLENNPRGIIITHTTKYKFTSADIPEYYWLLEELLNNDRGLSIEEIFAEDYHNEGYYYEENSVELENELTITDLNGNRL